MDDNEILKNLDNRIKNLEESIKLAYHFIEAINAENAAKAQTTSTEVIGDEANTQDS